MWIPGRKWVPGPRCAVGQVCAGPSLESSWLGGGGCVVLSQALDQTVPEVEEAHWAENVWPGGFGTFGTLSANVSLNQRNPEEMLALGGNLSLV